ncbi:DMT family transporter [Motiliproteus sp.]|uniref:DMT family transporter n=1 Tax=Motiliproteus sp. TaxID=1898955 RepID=UPI003BAD8E5B
MDSRKDNIDSLAMGMMLLFCLVWGLQQVLLKGVALDMAPVLQIAIRSGGAAILVALLMLWRKEALFSHDTWKPGLIAGVLFTLEFLFLGEGIRHTSASRAVVFLYCAPIFVALALHWRFPTERLSALQWLGVAAAFSGVAYSFLGGEADQSSPPKQWLGDLLSLMAAVVWAATTVVIRSTRLSQAPATQTLLYQLLTGLVLLLLAALLLGQTDYRLSQELAGSLLFQIVVVAFASYLGWFWLLRRYPASQLGIFSFLTPLFGVILGAWLLDETLEPRFITGALLVMAGMILVSGHRLLAQLIRRVSGLN